MSNTEKNTAAAAADVIIAAVMNNEQAQGSRQAKLVQYMFTNEVSYSLENIAVVFRLAGQERTDKVEALLQGVSDSYSNTVALRDTLKGKKKADKETFSEREALQLEGLLQKLRAANMLFTRALVGTYHLRKIEAYGLKVAANGALSFHHVVRDDKGNPVLDPKGNVTSTLSTMSGNSLVRAGQKTVDVDFQKTRKSSKAQAAGAPNPGKGGISPAADTIATRIRIGRSDKATPGFESMSDPEQDSLEKLFHEMLVAKFADANGVLDRKTLNEYLDDEFPVKPAKPAKAA